MKRSYRQIVRDYNRQYLYQVRLANAGDWRNEHCSRQHFAVTGRGLVMWFEKDMTVFGFDTGEQAAAFRKWADTCGIDWTRAPDEQPWPHPPLPPPAPADRPGYTGHGAAAVNRNTPTSRHSR